MSINQLITRLLKFAPLLAFLGYGSWAAVVNYLADAENYLRSGLVQGTYAFISTLFVRLITLRLYQHCSRYRHTKLITFLAVFILMIVIPTTLHQLFATKEILYSILPGLIIGSGYLFMILKYEVAKLGDCPRI